MYIFILTRINVRDMIIMSKGSVSMKELLKSKTMIGFMVFVLSLTIYTSIRPDKTLSLDGKTDTEIIEQYN